MLLSPLEHLLPKKEETPLSVEIYLHDQLKQSDVISELSSDTTEVSTLISETDPQPLVASAEECQPEKVSKIDTQETITESPSTDSQLEFTVTGSENYTNIILEQGDTIEQKESATDQEVLQELQGTAGDQMPDLLVSGMLQGIAR